VSDPKPLVIVPTYMTKPEEVETCRVSLASVRTTQGESVDLLAVDDGSPESDLVDELEAHSSELQFELVRKEENSGFAKTVNIGLRRCLTEGRHAVLLNADMEVTKHGWLSHFLATTDNRGRKAAVVGALLLYPTGLIQHAGIYFSLLTRTFDHRYKFGPGNLKEALVKEVCPVTAAFQFIRHDTLDTIGLYDEQFYLGWEDVDYCIRVFVHGESCIYNPNVRGFHHEMMFRGRPSERVKDWQNKSFMYLMMKWQSQSFADFVPFW